MKLLSIVIPSRNREYYCIEALKDILSYDRDDFEVCVCDNSDTDQLEEYVKEKNDPRVLYQHIKGRINSVINMDKAMRMATGEYVCMIGDDDTILPAIFEVAEWAKKKGCDNVTPRDMVTYFWPGALVEKGILKWPVRANDGTVEELNCEVQLEKFVRNGCLTYSDFLPRVYHGIVRRSILDQILKETGHIIGGLSPDIYMSISTACHCKSYMLISKPISVAGACGNSATSWSNTGGHRGGLEDIPHLYKRGPYTWDERVPKVFTVQTIWAETAMKAFEEMGREDLISRVNQGYLYAEMIRKNRGMKNILTTAISEAIPVRSKLANNLKFIKYFILKPIQRLGRGEIKQITVEGANDIAEATKQYMESISK